MRIYIFGLMLLVYAQARTDEETKERFTKFVMTCTKDHPVEMKELMQLQKYVVPTDKASKCLLACAYKKSGLLSCPVCRMSICGLFNSYHKTETNKSTRIIRLKRTRKSVPYVMLDGAFLQMNEKGLFNLEHAYKVAEQNKNGVEERLVNGRKLADLCVKDNDIPVSDGEKGCDRAALIFKCMTQNAPKLGFKL